MPIRATERCPQLRATTPVFWKLRLERPPTLLANVERTGARGSSPGDGLAAGWPCSQGEKQLQTLSLGSGTRNEASLKGAKSSKVAKCPEDPNPVNDAVAVSVARLTRVRC